MNTVLEMRPWATIYELYSLWPRISKQKEREESWATLNNKLVLHISCTFNARSEADWNSSLYCIYYRCWISQCFYSSISTFYSGLDSCISALSLVTLQSHTVFVLFLLPCYHWIHRETLPWRSERHLHNIPRGPFCHSLASAAACLWFDALISLIDLGERELSHHWHYRAPFHSFDQRPVLAVTFCSMSSWSGIQTGVMFILW